MEKVTKNTTEENIRIVRQVFDAFNIGTHFVDVHMNIDGRKSSFSVPGVIDVKLENFRNPVTGDLENPTSQI